MKIFSVILIIAVFLSAITLPVSAVKEDSGIRAGITVAAANDKGQSPNVNKEVGGADDNIPANREVVQAERRGEDAGEQQNMADNAHNMSQLREIARLSQEERNALLQNAGPAQATRVRNENEVRLAVHTLLAIENFTGGIGPQVSGIARDFNNSASVSLQLEERIMNRDAFSRFFFGGDRDAAIELNNLTIRNQVRIREIQQLMNTTTMDAETRTLMEEQLRIMQQEVARGELVSVQEQQNQGLFGWMRW